jgi:hypothetical protein
MKRRPNFIAAAVFIVLGLALGGFGVLQLRQAAARYQATAGIRVSRDQAELARLPAEMSDSVFLQNQIELIRSEAVLQTVATNLNLASAWNLSAGGATAPALAAEQLRGRVTVSQPPGMTQLQITAIGDDATQAQTLANALASAFCTVREERRQQALQAALDSIAEPLRENEAKFQRATQRIAQTRAALAPTGRGLESPSAPTESETLRELQQEAARLTMIVMVQSNQLARVQSLPAAELQKLTAAYARATNQLAALEAALQTEVQKQEALKNFWDARQELEQVNLVLVPLQKAAAENRRFAADTNNPPAVVSETADSASKLPARSPVAFGSLIGAVGLLLVGAKLLGSGSKA